MTTPSDRRALRWAAFYRWAGAAMLLALPLFLITLNVRVMFSAPLVYTLGFQRSDVPKTTGLPLSELQRIGGDIRAYLHGDQERLAVFLDGRPIFTPREVEHMADVKALLAFIYAVTPVAGAALAAYAVWGWRREGAAFLRRVGRGGLVAAIGLAATGIVLALGFPLFFTLFHEISFRNDYWILDPAIHFLVVLFPYRFWLEATVVLAALTIGEALALWLVGSRLARRWTPGGAAPPTSTEPP